MFSRDVVFSWACIKMHYICVQIEEFFP